MAGMHLEIRDLVRRSGESEILCGIDLNLVVEGITVIAGPSGAGKTSFLRQLNGLDAPSAGTVRWNGADLASADICALRRRVGHIAQRPAVFEGSVLENLLVADPTLDRTGARDLLRRIGLEDLIDQAAETLSGGEAQRMCLARTLATGATVVLADEPTSSLDAAATARIEQLARDLTEVDGLSWIWVSHDLDQIERLADTVIVMADGAVHAVGTHNELCEHPDHVVRAAVGRS